jgi:ABC-type branched-subunit amino acid transport system ATPase component
MSSNQVLLKVDGIDVAYGITRAVEGISLTVQEGKAAVIVGRNGAGKTTTLRAIAGYLKPSKGSIRFKNIDITSKAAHEVAKLGVRYIPQDKKVFSSLTVKENLEMASHATGDYDTARVLEYFPRLKMLLKNKARGLSGGERQMLLLARSLIGNPSLLLVDEPTEGLAPALVNDLADILRKMREKTNMVVVEQNLPIAARLADKIYIMKEGKITQEITAKEDIETLAFEKFL